MVNAPNVWYSITLLGEPELWLVLSATLVLSYLVMRQRLSSARREQFRRVLLLLIPAIATSMLMVVVLKAAIPVGRPCLPCTDGLIACNPFCTEDNSFPSGHSAIIFTVVTAVVLTTKRKEYLTLYVPAILVALSRVALGVHTYVDIYFGALLGLAVPLVVWSVEQRLPVLQRGHRGSRATKRV